MRALIILVTISLAGCTGDPVDPQALRGPSAWMMRPICVLPKPVADDGDPVARANYETQVRKCAAARGDQARGLQRYARAVTQKR